jgi:hypothetical protein
MNMTILNVEQFHESLKNAAPPAGLTRALVGLWYDRTGDWDAAHREVQKGSSNDEAWVHAYLHRKEGDLANASHWYRRCQHYISTGSLDEEWHEIVTTLLSRNANDSAS